MVSQWVAGVCVAMFSVLAASPCVAAVTMPPDNVLEFEILRVGSSIGTYHSDFEQTPDGNLEVRTSIRIDVSLGPIPLYHFENDAVETWRDDHLIGLISDTNDNNTLHHVEVREQEDKLVLTADGKSVWADRNSVPSSLWNVWMVDQGRPIFDFTDGQQFKASAHCEAGEDDADTACVVRGDLKRGLHYTPDGVLDGISMIADDGSRVVYERR